MSLYPVIAHVLLSAEAAALSPGLLEAQTLAAETVLGFLGTSYSGDRQERAKVAVARQVNLQVADDADDGIASETRGDRSVTYVTQNGITSAVDSLALQIAQALASEAAVTATAGSGSGFAPCKSFR